MSVNETTTEAETPAPVERLSELLEAIEQYPDTEIRDRVREIVFAVVDLHHAALHRTFELIGGHADGAELMKDLCADEHVSAILMIHGLMPQDLETRINQGLAAARQNLKAYGADAELISLTDGVAHLRLSGSAASANVSTVTLKREIEQALATFTPDLLDVQYEDTIAAIKPQNLIQISRQPAMPQTVGVKPTGIKLPIMRVDDVPANSMRFVEAGDISLVICNAAGTFHAFYNRCPHQALTLDKSVLEGTTLTCAWHGYQFDLRRQGQCLNDPELRLELLPLAVENGVIKVALQLDATPASAQPTNV